MAQDIKTTYLAITNWVLGTIKPLYDQAGVTFDSQTGHAITATLFISVQKAGGASNGHGKPQSAPSPVQSAGGPPAGKGAASTDGQGPDKCPDCGGTEFWDNRQTKKSPKGPDWKCRDKECGKGFWLTPFVGSPGGKSAPKKVAAARPASDEKLVEWLEGSDTDDGMPF